MKLREALKKSGWENFKNIQGEKWNVSDLLNEVLEGDSPTWLDQECTIAGWCIVDCENDILTEE